MTIYDIAMDLSQINDEMNYTKFIHDKLPRLHDQSIPSSLRYIAFLGQMLYYFKSNWPVDGLERGLELDRKEASIFSHQY